MKNLPVIVIGGGPVGMAAAAHLSQRGMPFMLFESGPAVGANIQDWAHVRLFSPWKYNIDQAAKQLLDASGWQAPPEDDLHTGEELIERYLQPLASLSQIKPHIHYNSTVVSVGRKNLDKVVSFGRDQKPFVVQAKQNGTIRQFEARAVIDATGTWSHPNPLGAGGIFADGEQLAKEHIFYGIPALKGNHRERYINKTVLVVGSGHSAMNSLLDLAELKKEHPNTRIQWGLRKEISAATFGGGDPDQLPARGLLGSRRQEFAAPGSMNPPAVVRL